MALIKCNGPITFKKNINLFYESGFNGWDATQGHTSTKNFSGYICPTKVTLFCKAILSNPNPGDWGASNTIFYLKNIATNSWEKIEEIGLTASYGNPSIQQTKSFDISVKTKGKRYSSMRMDVGYGSSSAYTNHIGEVTITEYKK